MVMSAPITQMDAQSRDKTKHRDKPIPKEKTMGTDDDEVL